MRAMAGCERQETVEVHRQCDWRGDELVEVNVPGDGYEGYGVQWWAVLGGPWVRRW